MARLSINKWIVLLGCVIGLAGSDFGQDLGSSNKLFGTSKPKTNSPKSTKKGTEISKKPTKPAPTATKTKAPPKKAATATATPKPTSKATKAATAPPIKKPVTSLVAKKPVTQPVAKKPITAPKVAAQKGKPTVVNATPTSKFEVKPSKPRESSPSTASSTADERFEGLIAEGNAARDDRNYSEAEVAYKKARTLKTKDSRANYGLGNLYSDQQRWEEAESAYRTALQLDPSSAIVHVALSYVLTQPIAAPNLSDRYEEAEGIAKRAIQLAPSNALAFDQLGVALELRGLIGADTEKAYRKAIQLDSTFAPAYAHLGRLLRRRGLTRESMDAYESAIKRCNDIATMILVADVMQSEQRFAESEGLLQTALNGDPKNPSALLLLGRALTAQGKYSDAERTLRSSLDINPNAFAANNLLGSLYSRQGYFDLAENALIQASRFVSPLERRGLSQQFEAVGDGYLKGGKPRDAERAYRQAINLDAENQSLVGKLTKAQRG